MEAMKTSQHKHELDAQSTSSASASPSASTMGQSGELLTYGDSTDDDMSEAALTKNKSSTHDVDTISSVPDFYASFPAAPAPTPMFLDGTETHVNPLNFDYERYAQEHPISYRHSEHDIEVDRSAGARPHRAASQPSGSVGWSPAPPPPSRSETQKSGSISAPPASQDIGWAPAAQPVSGHALSGQDLGQAPGLPQRSHPPTLPALTTSEKGLEEFDNLDADTKAYIFTHGTRSLPQLSTPVIDSTRLSPSIKPARAPSPAIPVTGDEYDFSPSSGAVSPVGELGASFARGHSSVQEEEVDAETKAREARAYIIEHGVRSSNLEEVLKQERAWHDDKGAVRATGSDLGGNSKSDQDQDQRAPDVGSSHIAPLFTKDVNGHDSDVHTHAHRQSTKADTSFDTSPLALDSSRNMSAMAMMPALAPPTSAEAKEIDKPYSPMDITGDESELATPRPGPDFSYQMASPPKFVDEGVSSEKMTEGAESRGLAAPVAAGSCMAYKDKALVVTDKTKEQLQGVKTLVQDYNVKAKEDGNRNIAARAGASSRRTPSPSPLYRPSSP